MRLFDLNVAIGRAANPIGGAFDSAASLLAEMDRLGIQEALVYHQAAAEADVLLGNRLLLDAIKDQPRLHPCWVMCPPCLGDLPPPGEWVAQAVESGVRAVRVFPRHSLFSPTNPSLDDLAEELEKEQIPLLLDFGQRHWSQSVIPWSELEAFCEGRPQLGVVLIGATIGDLRELVPRMQDVPNFWVETHALPLPDLYILAVEEGVAGGLLFGTGMPLRPGECAVEQLRRGSADDATLEAMGGDSARFLLGLAEPPDEPIPFPTVEESVYPTANLRRSPADVLTEIGERQRKRFWQASEPTAPAAAPNSQAVIDCHTHYGSWERVVIPMTEPEAILESMDRCGIDKIVGSSFTAIHGETRIGNAEAAALVAADSRRLYAYAVINPHYPAEVGEELKRCFEDRPGFVGLKLHCGLHGVQLEHPGYAAALAYADEHALPVLVHGGGRDSWRDVCLRYPRANFIIAHACAWDGWSEETRQPFALAREVSNLYVDVAGSPAYRGALRALVEMVGAEKVLFGSDFPMFDFAFELGRVTLSDLPAGDRTAVHGGNASRLFTRISS